jgi:hypothetical protein
LQSKFDQELLLWKNQQKPIVFHLTFDLRGRETLTGKVLEVDQFFIKISEIPPTGKALWLGKGNLLAAGEF